MPLHGFSACPALWDIGSRDWVDTKKEKIDRCTIEESILKRDFWKERDRPDSMEGQRKTGREERVALVEQEGKGKRTGQEGKGKRTGQEGEGKESFPKRVETGSEAEGHGDYNDYSSGLSLAGPSCSGREETIICEDVSLISDYGHDLLCYRLFFLSAASDFGLEKVGLRVAEESSGLVRCRGMPDSSLKDHIESGYGIEIKHFRMKQDGFCLMKDFERLEGISEDLETCLTFFYQLVEGRVYPSSLADLCEDYSELF